MSGTTSKGIPYPTNTDNIDFAADMQALAEGVDNNFLALAGGTLTGAITANSGIGKGYRLNNEAGSANARLWSNYVTGSTWRVGAVNDAASTSTDYLIIDRTTATISLEKPAKLKTFAFQMTGSGTLAASSPWVKANIWDNVTYDYGSGCDLTNDQYVVPTSGLWWLRSYMSINDSTKLGVAFKSSMYVNGVGINENISEGNTDATTAVSRKSTSLEWVGLLNAGDVVTLYYSAAWASSTALEGTTARRPVLQGYMISAT